mmetsp:Transcript_6829/g.23502  ORF Transcript_6829/g.23502 Transcript_6829/m.23502 type:complete len:742 (+) Transcript_6829:50-2275(+)
MKMKSTGALFSSSIVQQPRRGLALRRWWRRVRLLGWVLGWRDVHLAHLRRGLPQPVVLLLRVRLLGRGHLLVQHGRVARVLGLGRLGVARRGGRVPLVLWWLLVLLLWRVVLLLMLLLRWRRLLVLLLVLLGGLLVLLLLLLLVSSVRQLPRIVVPLHLARQAKVPALHLESLDGVLQGGVETDPLLEIGLDLLVDLECVGDLGLVRRALRPVLVQVVAGHKVRVGLDQVGDGSSVRRADLCHRGLERLVLLELLLENFLLRVGARHELWQYVVLEFGLAEPFLELGPAGLNPVQVGSGSPQCRRGGGRVCCAHRDHPPGEVGALLHHRARLQQQDRALRLLQLLQRAPVRLPRGLNLPPEVGDAIGEGRGERGGRGDGPLVAVPLPLRGVLRGLPLELLLGLVQHLRSHVSKALELLGELKAVRHPAEGVHLGDLLPQGLRQHVGQVVATSGVKGREKADHLELLHLLVVLRLAPRKLCLFRLDQRVHKLSILADHLGARVGHQSNEDVRRNLGEVPRGRGLYHAGLRNLWNGSVVRNGLQVDGLVFLDGLAEPLVAQLRERLGGLRDKVVGALAGLLSLLDLDVRVTQPRDLGANVRLVLLLLGLRHQQLGLRREVKDLGPQVVQPALLQVPSKRPPRDDLDDLLVEQHALLAEPRAHPLRFLLIHGLLKDAFLGLSQHQLLQHPGRVRRDVQRLWGVHPHRHVVLDVREDTGSLLELLAGGQEPPRGGPVLVNPNLRV